MDTVGGAFQGCSVAVSGDGNTAIVGGYGDAAVTGAAWVYTRSAGVWSQQGSKLVGAGAAGSAAQGWSVAISADGLTAIVGAPSDNLRTGAAWVFTRGAEGWSQSGGKLVGSGAVGPADQGPVAISGDGSTAVVGGPSDDSGTGAAWVFARAGGCRAPAIIVQPQSRSVRGGQTATLSVTATGTADLRYQWYQGVSGDTSTPVGGDEPAFTTLPLVSTADFWVRVSNSCGTTDSAAATITVGRGVRRRLQGVA